MKKKTKYQFFESSLFGKIMTKLIAKPILKFKAKYL